MFERYTERARRVLFFARYEATQLGSAAVAPEHFLLGLIREGKGISARIFQSTGLSLENVRERITQKIETRSPVSTSVEIPFTAEAKRVLWCAMEEADGLLHNDIGTEHLLLGLLKEASSLAASVLRDLGLELEPVRARVAELHAQGPETPDHATPAPGAHPIGGGVSAFRISRTPDSRAQSHLGRRTFVSWTLAGVSLRALLAAAYDISEARINLPPALDREDLYDIALVLTKTEEAWSITRRMREGIEQHFRINVDRQPVSRSVLVMTAPEGAIRAERASAESGGGLMAMSGTLDVEGSGSLSDPLDHTKRLMTDLKTRRADGVPIQGLSGTMSFAHLCDMIEHWSGGPVIDETHIEGTFHIDVRSAAGTTEGFFDALQQQTGLVVTPEQRDVTTLIVRPADERVI